LVLNYIINYALIAASSIIAVFTLAREPRRFGIAYLIASFLSVIIFIMTHNAEPVLGMILAIAGIKYMYRKESIYYGSILLAMLLGIFILTKDHAIWPFLDVSIGVGMMLGLISDKESMGWVARNTANRGRNTSRETGRDALQIAGGIIMIVLLLLFGAAKSRIAYTVALVILLIAGTYLSLHPRYALSRYIINFERHGVPLGIGAIWFGSGIIIAYGLTDSIRLLTLILLSVTVCDPLATIIGMRIKSPRIFYNTKKTIAGTATFALIAAFAGYLILSWSGVFIGILGAVIESIPYEAFDDNFMIPVVLALSSYFI